MRHEACSSFPGSHNYFQMLRTYSSLKGFAADWHSRTNPVWQWVTLGLVSSTNGQWRTVKKKLSLLPHVVCYIEFNNSSERVLLRFHFFLFLFAKCNFWTNLKHCQPRPTRQEVMLRKYTRCAHIEHRAGKGRLVYRLQAILAINLQYKVSGFTSWGTETG